MRASEKADPTNYINYMKPLVLASELRVPHVVSVIDTRDEWYRRIHPERYVPALKDRDPATGEDFYVFESTACLQHLSEAYDPTGLWKGSTVAEKAAIYTWTAYQTAGLGSVSAARCY